MKTMNYQPESYWSTIGKRIKERSVNNVIAGDDEPFYHYKRKKFLALLNEVPFQGKKVAEIGCGPGGNLVEILKKSPLSLSGFDISEQMISLAKEKLPATVNLTKTNGTKIPAEDKTFDIVFTATVLQHNTDRNMLENLIREIARISASKVYFFERVEPDFKGDELCEGRPVSYYKEIMSSCGFRLQSTTFINIGVSYYVSGAIRKLLNPKHREEGERISKTSEILQKITLPVTKILDNIYKPSRDLARLEFDREA
jgi:ubiquinone/menaquinone biosynthesis C-methylase UbiE